MFAKVLDSSLCSCAILHGAHANSNAVIHGEYWSGFYEGNSGIRHGKEQIFGVN